MRAVVTQCVLALIAVTWLISAVLTVVPQLVDPLDGLIHQVAHLLATGN